jgi:hypothetical protein
MSLIARAAVSILAVQALFACGGNIDVPQPTNPNNPTNNPTPSTPTMNPPMNPMVPTMPMTPMNPTPTSVPAGNVSGSWCGTVNVQGSVTIASGQSLDICAGANVTFADNALFTVTGMLKVNGTSDQHVSFTASNRWTGVRVSSGGSLTATNLDMTKASLCFDGLVGSTIQVTGATLMGCGQSLSLANGGTFDKTIITGGITASFTGGSLNMTDSVIDLQHAGASPDCTDWSGGGAILDHVRLTGCHCPIHINSTNMPFKMTNSILDRAGVPVMIADSTNATFNGNNILSTGPQFLDIGGGIHADVSGNFWGTDGATTGHAPGITSSNIAQFTGMGSYSQTPIAGAGPRM